MTQRKDLSSKLTYVSYVSYTSYIDSWLLTPILSTPATLILWGYWVSSLS